ncbi:uncharacterized protein FRV6_11997 [Fusarium oxysporum]|uniref:Uncharacterized protein n=1 Tax=Fusarium oxysporum TaxID=5507 RepID=A0A2H3TST1_FUSOX|nr:uncharacterized protein FRV6_11997 [Fusarium oxysporum]
MVSKHPPDPSKYRAYVVHERHQFISLYLSYLGNDESARWEDKLKLVYETIMQDLDKKDLKDHKADRIAWDKHFRDGCGEAIMWPFQSIDATPDDIADAISPTYQTWRLSRGLPICDSPKTFGDRKATVLSLSQLQMLWDEFSPYSSLKGQPPVTGPYQIVLPAWIDTDNLFFGRGHLLDTINSEIILLHLAVSWNKEDESYLTFS